jgi:hypothetical protein
MAAGREKADYCRAGPAWQSKGLKIIGKSVRSLKPETPEQVIPAKAGIQQVNV